MKHLIILSIAIFPASPTFAERSSFRDRSDNWLQNQSSETTSGDLRGNRFGDEIGNAQAEPGVPVGESILILAALTGGYALIKRKK
ncbi:MAG: hypothetical protein LBG77_00465 [Dysgonamonadaceae bacterium]|jgi:hypothetical protein|nr:hypothetical protein [Dysgonamonadaceae bacterium]